MISGRSGDFSLISRQSVYRCRAVRVKGEEARVAGLEALASRVGSGLRVAGAAVGRVGADRGNEHEERFFGIVLEKIEHVVLRHALAIVDVLKRVRAERVILPEPVDVVSCFV